MKRSELEYDVRYALKSERTGLWQPVYIIGKEWLRNGTYTGAENYRKPAGRGGAVLAVIGVGTDWEQTEDQARNYTDARHVALNAIIDQIGDDALLDAILFPADGWTAQILGDTVYSTLVPWEDVQAELQREEREAIEKFTTLRKFRTQMLKVLRAADTQTLGGKTLTVAPPVKVADESELKKAKAEARRLKKQLDALENPKDLDTAAVTNYQRALKAIEDWFVTEEHVSFPSEAAANLAAHDLLIKVAAVLVDEPRQVSNRAKTFEVGAAKTALWERWRKGSDGNGYDWLGGEDQDPVHVIDVLVSTLMARGWAPTEPTQ